MISNVLRKAFDAFYVNLSLLMWLMDPEEKLKLEIDDEV